MAVALGLACAAYSGQATASTIVVPVSAEASSQYTLLGYDYSIDNTFNQAGLFNGYNSGVDDFDTYLATMPEHTSYADGNEWFSENFRNTRRRLAGLTITYKFSEVMSINSFALWNDEFAGLGKTKLQYSADGNTYSTLLTITPKPSEFAPGLEVVPYLAQVFPFSLTDMLFFRLVIADCPGPPRGYNYRGCGIGEVAFSAILPPPPGPVDNNPIVPLPAALPLFGSALGFFVWMGRRRKNCN